jgi:hypothetical protein
VGDGAEEEEEEEDEDGQEELGWCDGRRCSGDLNLMMESDYCLPVGSRNPARRYTRRLNEEERDDHQDDSDSDDPVAVDDGDIDHGRDGALYDHGVSFGKYRRADVTLLLPASCKLPRGLFYDDRASDIVNSVPISFFDSIQKPRRHLTSADIDCYNTHVMSARKFEAESEWTGAISSYLQAIEVCDEDVILHGKLAFLSRKMEYL